MTVLSLERCASGLGPTLTRLAAALAGLGFLAFALGLLLGRSAVALAALDASWLFFAGLSAGSVALAAAVRTASGRWADSVLPVADAGAGFFVPALALLLILVLGARALFPGAAAVATGLRLLLPSAILFALGRRLVTRARRPGDEGGTRSAAVVYLLVYVVSLSLWTFDLVMKPWGPPPATVLPAYFFLGAFLSGLAWVGLVAAVRGTSGPDLRHDIGKLLFAFIVVWSYLLWALFLPIWYGNVPEESAALLLRWQGAYRPVTLLVLVAVFAWPFWLLFSERMKRRRSTLAVGAGAVLLGLWAERFLLVLPSLSLPGGAGSLLVGAGVTLGVAGLFLLSVGARFSAPASGAWTTGQPGV